MFLRTRLVLTAILAFSVAGCQYRSSTVPADYAGFLEVGSRQWVTQVQGLTPEKYAKIRELVEAVKGVEKGSVVIKADYVACNSTASQEDMLEHTRVGEDVRVVLKAQPGLQVGGSMTGPQ
jgi:hypothetical protein